MTVAEARWRVMTPPSECHAEESDDEASLSGLEGLGRAAILHRRDLGLLGTIGWRWRTFSLALSHQEREDEARRRC